MRCDLRSEGGIALVATLMVMLVLVALTGALIPLTLTETRVTMHHRRALQGMYAAEAALAWVVAELRHAPSWSGVLAGTYRSSYRVGGRQRPLPDGSSWDLGHVTAELERVGAGPHGSGRGRPWRVYAYGPLDGLLPHDPSGGLLDIGVWVAGVPLLEEEALLLHVVAVGPAHASRAVQATLRRSPRTRRPLVASWALVQ